MALIKYEKKDGTTAWRFRVYAGINPATGKQIFIEQQGFPSKKAAQIQCHLRLANINKNGFASKSEKTFAEVYNLWLINYRLTVKESSYVKLLQKFNKHILPALGSISIKKITTVKLQEFANHMFEINAQFKEYISNVSRIFDYAIKLNLLDHNPVKKITIPRRKKNLTNKEVKFFTEEELKLFLSFTKQNESAKVYTFFYLMANTGCRTGELLGLQWHSIDFNTKSLSVVQTLARGENRRLYLEEPKTQNSKRMIPLSDTTLQALKEWRLIQQQNLLKLGINSNNDEQLIFSNLSNSFLQLTQPRLWMQRITKRANLPELSPHALRHTFATLLISNGVDFKTVSTLLGHASIAMTLDVYSGIYEKNKTSTIKLLEKVLN